MNKYTWESSENAELWQHDLFDTVQDCIADAVENYEFNVGDVIYIGNTLDFGVFVDADDVLERLEEEASEFAGEAAESWKPSIDASKEALEELSEQLSNVVEEWLSKYSLETNFYQIDNVNAVEIE